MAPSPWGKGHQLFLDASYIVTDLSPGTQISAQPPSVLLLGFSLRKVLGLASCTLVVAGG